MTEFRQMLSEESDHPLSDPIFDAIVENSDTRTYARREAIIDIGQTDPDVYIITEGVVRGYMLSDGVEQNKFFGLPGTLITSMYCFSMNEASVLRIEACCPTRVLHLSRQTFTELQRADVDFAMWVTGVFSRREYFAEKKSKIMSGDARWRYTWLKNCRPELLKYVSNKAIASYLGITEVHLSRIRRTIMSEK